MSRGVGAVDAFDGWVSALVAAMVAVSLVEGGEGGASAYGALGCGGGASGLVVSKEVEFVTLNVSTRGVLFHYAASSVEQHDSR